MLRLTLQLLLAADDFVKPDYVRPESADSPRYLEILERNTPIIYPALGILVVVLIVAGLLQAWKTQDIDGLQKVELKREIILELRRQVHGAPAEAISKVVGLESIRLMKVLEEMQKDGVLESHTTSSRLTIWSLKGMRNTGHGASH